MLRLNASRHDDDDDEWNEPEATQWLRKQSALKFIEMPVVSHITLLRIMYIGECDNGDGARI